MATENYQKLKWLIENRKDELLQAFFGGQFGGEVEVSLARLASEIKVLDEIWVSYGLNWVSDASH
jgi:hypothetical protein